MKWVISLFLLTMPLVLFSQNNFYILRAEVSDEQTDMPLPEAAVAVKEIGKHFISDQSGLIRMALVPGDYTLITTHDDYVLGIKKIVVTSDSTFTIKLKPFDKSVVIEEVTVVENMPLKSNRIETGLELLSSVSISSIPAIAGEKDIVKSLALKPGMQIASEGVSRLIVRGGNPDQNLFLLNGLPIFQTNHFFSFLSVVNPMLIDQVEVYKSGFPAHYGGRVSSVIDMEVKTPGMDRVHGEGDIGLLSAKAMVSVPLIKNKLAVMASARRTYLDLLGRAIIDQLEDLNFSYTDFSFSANWNLSDKNKITFFNYYSRDDFTLNYDEEYTGVPLSDNGKSWDNLLSGIQWRYAHGRFSNELKAGYSGNNTNRGVAYGTDTLAMYEKLFYSRLQNFILTDRINFDFSNRIKLDAGLQIEEVQLAPASVNYTGIDSSWTQQRISEGRFESGAVWASVNYEGIKFRAQAGLRGSLYLYNGLARFIAEPRVNLQYFLSKNSSIKTSYSRISQPLHLLSNTGLGLPVDLWIGLSEKRKPMVSNQWAAGYYMNFPVKGRRFEISFEGFYKTTENLLCYRDGFSSHIFTTANYSGEPNYLDEVTADGHGKSYGIEFLFEKLEGDFTGWVSYTLSKSLHSFKDFENGKWFNSPYDRPHNLSVVGSYILGKGWDVNFSFSLLSGQPFTVPVAVYPTYSFNILTSEPLPPFSNTIYINSERNGFRLKTFHKLDIGVRKQLKGKRNYSHWLELSVYNVYNRANSTYGYIDPYREGRLNVVSVSIFPIIPSVSYGFRF